MKQREYKIKIYSISRFLIAMVIILCSLSILTVDYLPRIENKIISILQFLAIFMTSFYLANLIGRGKAKIVFNQEGFQHIWLHRFILSWEKNFKIPWNLVDNYVFQEDRTFDSFIINLTNKTRYKINRLNILPIKDDFNRLVKDFPSLSNDYKNGLDSDNEIKQIKEGQSIYVSKSYRWVFFFLLIGFLILVLTKVLNPNSETTWSSLGIIGSGVLFYGLMIKEKKNNN